MPVIALTGGIAAGKSAACAHFANLGVPIIDTDQISHSLTGANGAAIPLIRNTFGDAYVNEQQALNRQKMRELVFSDPQAKAKLEKILHPMIHAQVEFVAKQNATLLENIAGVHYQIIAVPLLFETKHYAKLANAILVIDCDPELQLSRAMQRSQLSREAVEAIIKTQIARDKRLALADYVVENNLGIDDLNVKIDVIHQRLNQFCHKMHTRY